MTAGLCTRQATSARICFALVALLAIPLAALAGQGSCPNYPIDKRHNVPVLPDRLDSVTYAIPKLDAVSLGNLRAALQAGSFARALNIYYHCVRAKGYLDWIVYVNAVGDVRQVLMDGDEVVKGKVRGERYAWLLVFSDSLPERKVPPKDSQTGPSITSGGFRFARRTVAIRHDPALATILGALGRVAGGATVSAASASQRADSTIVATGDSLRIAGLTAPDGIPQLYVTTGRVALDDDAETSISISLDTGTTYGAGIGSRFHSISAQFANASSSPVEVTVGIGATRADTFSTFTTPTKDFPTPYVSSKSGGVSAGLFLVSTFNVIKRPWFPRDSEAIGVSIATNLLPGSLLDDIVS